MSTNLEELSLKPNTGAMVTDPELRSGTSLKRLPDSLQAKKISKSKLPRPVFPPIIKMMLSPRVILWVSTMLNLLLVRLMLIMSQVPPPTTSVSRCTGAIWAHKLRVRETSTCALPSQRLPLSMLPMVSPKRQQVDLNSEKLNFNSFI